MEAFGDLLFSILLVCAGGGAMAVLGAIALLVARKADPAPQRSLRRIGWPLFGCGGLIALTPVVIFAGIVLFGMGVVTFCGDKPGCERFNGRPGGNANMPYPGRPQPSSGGH